MNKWARSTTLIATFMLAACGSDGGSDSELVIQGTLTQGGSGGHERIANGSLLHGAGSRIGEVTVCALGACSVTDSIGQWGFNTSSEFGGGEVLFTLDGHGIGDEVVVSIPEGASDVAIDFENTADGVKVEEMIVDGAEHDHDSHDHETEHEHDA